MPKLSGRPVHELSRDYNDVVAKIELLGLEEAAGTRLAAYHRFIERNSHRIARLPGELHALALDLPQDSSVRQDVVQAESRLGALRRPFFRRLHPPEFDPFQALIRVLDEHTDDVISVALTPNARWALSGSDDRTVRFWDLSTGQCRAMLEGHASGVTSVALTPDSRWALSGSLDNTVRFWDLSSGQCRATLEGHAGQVYSVALTPDARWALSGSGDKTVRFWDLSTGQCHATLEGHTGGVNSVALTPDRRRALSGESFDRTVASGTSRPDGASPRSKDTPRASPPSR